MRFQPFPAGSFPLRALMQPAGLQHDALFHLPAGKPLLPPLGIVLLFPAGGPQLFPAPSAIVGGLLNGRAQVGRFHPQPLLVAVEVAHRAVFALPALAQQLFHVDPIHVHGSQRLKLVGAGDTPPPQILQHLPPLPALCRGQARAFRKTVHVQPSCFSLAHRHQHQADVLPPCPEPLAGGRHHPPLVVLHVSPAGQNVLRQKWILVCTGQEHSRRTEIGQRLSLALAQGIHFVLRLLPLAGFLPLLAPAPVFLGDDGEHSDCHVVIPALVFFLSDVVTAHPGALLLAFTFC